MSPYADKVMESLFEQARTVNLITVSGLARGVDQKCHQLSLQGGIPTIAILGGGLRRYLKSSAKKLIEQIVEGGGLVLSEFKLDFKPTNRSFPQRNRLIAGLSDVLFLPEAREGSGSLITANFALQMKKEIFVAPNQLFSANGGGSNQLVSEGKVKLLTHFDQLLGKFDKSLTENREIGEPTVALTPEEKVMLEWVKKYAHQDLSVWSSEVGRDF
jgi:DNA processing protein